MAKIELWYPVKPLHVNQPFGVNGAYYQANGIGIAGHNGIDFMAYHGQPVYAAHDGFAKYEVDDNQGHGVILISDKPYEYKGQQVYFKSIYWHLVDPTKDAQYPQPIPLDGSFKQVKCGDIIGYADSTGLSTGDHLHFGLKPIVSGQAMNGWTADVTDGGIPWVNVEQTNGYLGAIDPAPFFNGYFACDHDAVIANLEAQVTAYRGVAGALRQLWDLVTGKNAA